MARLSGPAGRIEHTELLVDTGATFLVIPQSLADRLAIVPTRHLPVLIAGGTRTKGPVGEIRIDIEGQETAPRPDRGIRALIVRARHSLI